MTIPIPSISNKTETLNRVTLFLSFFGSSCNDTPQSSGVDQRYLHRKHRGVHLSWTACWGAEMTDVTWQMCKKMVSWSCHGVTWSQELTCFTTCWLFSAPAEALVLQSPIDRMDRLATQKMRGISSFSGWFFCPFLGILNTSLAQLQISGDWYPRHSQWLGV